MSLESLVEILGTGEVGQEIIQPEVVALLHRLAKQHPLAREKFSAEQVAPATGELTAGVFVYSVLGFRLASRPQGLLHGYDRHKLCVEAVLPQHAPASDERRNPKPRRERFSIELCLEAAEGSAPELLPRVPSPSWTRSFPFAWLDVMAAIQRQPKRITKSPRKVDSVVAQLPAKPVQLRWALSIRWNRTEPLNKWRIMVGGEQTEEPVHRWVELTLNNLPRVDWGQDKGKAEVAFWRAVVEGTLAQAKVELARMVKVKTGVRAEVVVTEGGAQWGLW